MKNYFKLILQMLVIIVPYELLASGLGLETAYRDSDSSSGDSGILLLFLFFIFLIYFLFVYLKEKIVNKKNIKEEKIVKNKKIMRLEKAKNKKIEMNNKRKIFWGIHKKYFNSCNPKNKKV